MTTLQAEALSRAVSGQSETNYGPIVLGFMARGIPEAEIQPRVNVFTFHAWQALGRTVRKGEKSVKVTTFRPVGDKVDPATGRVVRKGGRMPWTAYVFHVSQTEPIAG